MRGGRVVYIPAFVDILLLLLFYDEPLKIFYYLFKYNETFVISTSGIAV
jgi:hypothetical protein